MKTTDTRIEELSKGNKKGLKESNQTPSTELTIYILSDNNFFDNYIIIGAYKTKQKAQKEKIKYIKSMLLKPINAGLTWFPEYVQYKEYILK